MASVEGVPAAAQVNLVPAAEIHRQHERHADVAHVTRHVTSGDVHAAAKREGEMTEVAADAARIVVNVEGRFRVVGELVTKSDVVMNPFADRLGARPAGGGLAEKLPGNVGKLVDFAVATGEEERQRVVR